MVADAKKNVIKYYYGFQTEVNLCIMAGSILRQVTLHVGEVFQQSHKLWLPRQLMEQLRPTSNHHFGFTVYMYLIVISWKHIMQALLQYFPAFWRFFFICS